MVGLNQLREHGPAGPVFARFGRSGPQPLLEAIGNPRLDAARACAQAQYRACEEMYQEQMRRAAQEQAAKQAAEREARRPVCAGCGAKFTDERWAAQATDWGTPKDCHPQLCEGCKQTATAAAASPAARTLEHREPERGGAGWDDFRRNTRRPVCTECGAEFTDERWRATERVGWGTTQESRPTLCGDCDQRHENDWEETWPGAIRRDQDQDQDQEQEQAVPEQKAGWLSRLRR
ncbi:hypothetical protein [Streptomyces lateritius]|uniref:hypothetical protein n=1 Tax=Streptomyces lateritius TaxID=67313 RepID=UPI00198D52AF|nr:hypothetical protein [Streptomyces lateritius]GGU12087.1 hypothetical protein GCM10010272_66600 [Streptomyces lateritius]